MELEQRLYHGHSVWDCNWINSENLKLLKTFSPKTSNDHLRNVTNLFQSRLWRHMGLPGVRSLLSSCRWFTSHKIPEVSSVFVGALSILLSPGQLVAAKTAELFRERDLRRVRSASRDKNSGHSCRVAMEGCHKDMTQVGSGHKNIHFENKRCRGDECLLCFTQLVETM